MKKHDEGRRAFLVGAAVVGAGAVSALAPSASRSPGDRIPTCAPLRSRRSVTNHMKVRRRENAGRKRGIAFHQMPHNDSDSARSGMVVSVKPATAVRVDLLGVTSIVRALNLRSRLYTKLLQHFHSTMVQVGSGHPIGTIDSQFVNHDRAHDPDKTRRAGLRESEATSIPAPCRHDGYPGARATAPIQNGP
jgi:hypothetical protein